MRLIDMDALVARMATVYHDTDLRARYTEVMRAIMEQPTVDVVRCKECTYWDKTDSEMGRCWCTVHAAMTRPDWFCWAGYPWEEQEEEDDDG